MVLFQGSLLLSSKRDWFSTTYNYTFRPMDEPILQMGALFLPSSIKYDPYDFMLEDSAEDEQVDVDEETRGLGCESPSKIHQGIVKAKVLAAAKGNKFSIKKHLKAAYYTKRR